MCLSVCVLVACTHVREVPAGTAERPAAGVSTAMNFTHTHSNMNNVPRPCYGSEGEVTYLARLRLIRSVLCSCRLPIYRPQDPSA